MIDRKPAIIIGCAGVADVIEAIAYARRNKLFVSIRGGGHNVSGAAVCDGGMVIDLSAMKAIRVDPARTVRAEGGVTWGELDRETRSLDSPHPVGSSQYRHSGTHARRRHRLAGA